MQLTVPDLSEKCHDAMSGGWVSAFWAILLLAVLAYSYAATLLAEEERPEEVSEGHAAPTSGWPSQRLELAIDGMTCSHCVATVTARCRRATASHRSKSISPRAGRWFGRG